MVYINRTPDGTVRLEGGSSGGPPGTPGTDGTDGTDGLTPQLRGVSTSSVTIGTGSKTFAISPAMNVAFEVSTMVRATGSTSTNYMTGIVTAATTTSVTINVLETGGIGTFANWTLTVSGLKGATGDKGTRWGFTPSWVLGPTAAVECSFEDGLPPRVGDLVISTNGFGIGDVYVITAPVDTTHADMDITNSNLRGPQGPPGVAGANAPIDAWPVDSIFFGYTATNPATLLGGGTWSQIGQGKMLIGQDPTDVDFDTVGETGGTKTTTLTTPNLPPHGHDMTHGHYLDMSTAAGNSNQNAVRGTSTQVSESTGPIVQNAKDTGLGNGTSTPFSNMPPYLVVYMWRRTA